jgi:hypothetical protein
MSVEGGQPKGWRDRVAVFLVVMWFGGAVVVWYVGKWAWHKIHPHHDPTYSSGVTTTTTEYLYVTTDRSKPQPATTTLRPADLITLVCGYYLPDGGASLFGGLANHRFFQIYSATLESVPSGRLPSCEDWLDGGIGHFQEYDGRFGPVDPATMPDPVPDAPDPAGALGG